MYLSIYIYYYYYIIYYTNTLCSNLYIDTGVGHKTTCMWVMICMHADILHELKVQNVLLYFTIFSQLQPHDALVPVIYVQCTMECLVAMS